MTRPCCPTYCQIPPDVEIGLDTADGAYDTRKCHDAIGERWHQTLKNRILLEN